MTLSEVMDRIDSAEFTTWQADYELAPWGELRGDIQSANIARMILMAQTGKDISQWAFMPALSPDTEKPKQTTAQMKHIFIVTKAMKAAAKGK